MSLAVSLPMLPKTGTTPHRQCKHWYWHCGQSSLHCESKWARTAVPPHVRLPVTRLGRPNGNGPLRGFGQGGQPGHEGVSRKLRPVSEVSEVIAVKPSRCQQCGHRLEGEDPVPLRHQVTERRQVVAETFEYQLQTLECPGCGTRTSAELPAEAPRGAFGPRVQAIVAALSGQYHLSKRQREELMVQSSTRLTSLWLPNSK